jgi:hypothetical protein
MATGGLIGSGRRQLASALYGLGEASKMQSIRERANAELEAARAQRDAKALGSIIGSVGSLLLNANWGSTGGTGGGVGSVGGDYWSGGGYLDIPVESFSAPAEFSGGGLIQ